MPITNDILATYRGPRRVARRLLDMGVREDRAIMWLMVGCLIMFISRLPALRRAAFLNGSDYTQDVAYAFLGLVMFLPLLFYVLALIGWLVARILGSRLSGFDARLALFWAWLAASPVALFYGLLAGFNGTESPGTALTGGLWLLVVLWFWTSGLREASAKGAA